MAYLAKHWEMRFCCMRDHRETFEVGVVCRVLEVFGSGYYAWRRRQGTEGRRGRENRRLTERIRGIPAGSRETYGAPRIQAVLRREREPCG